MWRTGIPSRNQFAIPLSLAANAAVIDANDARGDVDVAGLVELDMTAALGDPGEDLERKIISPIIKSF